MTLPSLDGGLHLDQGPPLSLPLRYFLTGPLFLLAAGALLVAEGPLVLSSRYLPEAIAFTHLNTLGVFAMVMFGALYQMTPVVAASRVPHVGTGRAVHLCLTAGTVALVLGWLAQRPWALHLAQALLALAWVGFVLPVGIALWRSPAQNDATVRGMQLALTSVAGVGLLGLWMVLGHTAHGFPGPRQPFMTVHLGLGLLGWLGGLIVAVSFQVIPMFYLTPSISERVKHTLLASIALGAAFAVGALVLGMLFDAGRGWGRFVAWAFAPAALGVWVVHPMVTLRAISQRKRKRRDASLRFWIAGLALAPLVALAATAVVFSDSARAELLFVWLTLGGWALFIVHGMLYRIVPFLVWFHRLSPYVGFLPVPSAAKLLPESWPRQAFALHLLLLASGLVATLLPVGIAARLPGVLLVLLGLHLLRSLWHLARYPAPVGAGELEQNVRHSAS